MPTYEYRCIECDNSLEVVQRFSDDPLTVCPSCSGRLRKVFSPVGVVFKGSGFYKTDSRSTGRRSAASAASDGKGDNAGESEPAAAKGGASDGKASDGGASPTPATSTQASSSDTAKATPKESVNKVA